MISLSTATTAVHEGKPTTYAGLATGSRSGFLSDSLAPTTPSFTPMARAPLSLRIVVVGGSIAGVAAAAALQRAGHSVVVIEKTDGQTRCRSNIRCPPNMARILDEWGLGKDIVDAGQKSNKFVFQKGADAELLSVIPLYAELLHELRANFIRIEHGDTYSLLLKHALQKGVDVRFNCTASSLDFKPANGGTTVTLGNGEVLHADLVVGADGPNSSVREAAFDQKMESEYGTYVYLNYSGPLEALESDPETKQLVVEPDVWPIWLGPRYLVYFDVEHYRSRYSLSIVLNDTISVEQAKQLGDEWTTTQPPSIEDFGVKKEQFEPRILKAMEHATEGMAVGHQHRPPLESLVGNRGSVVLVGEAAHPMMPNALHVGSLCIEDAEVLGRLFSRIEVPKEVPVLLTAYEELRLPRHAKILDYEKRRQTRMTLPDGLDMEARNAHMQKSLGAFQKYEELDEKSFNEIWGEEVSYYAYNAREAVDDWYSKWGRVITRERGLSLSS